MSPIHAYSRRQLAATVSSPIVRSQTQFQPIQDGPASISRHSFPASTPCPPPRLVTKCVLNSTIYKRLPRNSTINRRLQRPYPFDPPGPGEQEKENIYERVDEKFTSYLNNPTPRRVRSTTFDVAGNACTPSEFLISVLKEWGSQFDLPNPHPDKVDLSWHDPFNPKKANRDRRLRGGNNSHLLPPRISCVSIVGWYIRYVAELPGSSIPTDPLETTSLDDGLLRTFDDETLEYLSRNGYAPRDVMTWAWIITSPDSLTAIQRYTAVEESIFEDVPQRGRVPNSIFLFLLRRKNINEKALHLFLLRFWEILHDHHPLTYRGNTMGSQASIGSPAWPPIRDTRSIIAIVRFIRAARRVYPQSLYSIAHMFTFIFGDGMGTRVLSQLGTEKAQLLTRLYNRCLSLLAVACTKEPYHSIQIQQRASFHIIGDMAKFQPPLTVTREGYRAISKILLAAKKTFPERRWADFKAESWPPWKEDKLGIDEGRGRGMEGSESKAFESLMRMKEAGYTWGPWEYVASILAGWDTDGTPTIQTRTILHRPSTQNQLTVANATQENSDIWAARIRATRTIKEAWACLLAYQDTGLVPSRAAYTEMLEKLIQFDNLQQSTASASADTVPGDAKELSPDPASPRDVIYVHTEPPSLNEFIYQLPAKGIKLSRKMLALILAHAPSFEIGMQSLSQGEIDLDSIKALGLDHTNVDIRRKIHLENIDDHVFAAFIQFLSKFSGSPKSPTDSISHIFPITYPPFLSGERPPGTNREVTAEHALSHAVFLVRLRMPHYMPTWHYLLSALATERLPTRHRIFPLSVQRVIIWREIIEVLRWMENDDIDLDMKCLQIVCIFLSKLILTVRRDYVGVQRGLMKLGRIKNRAQDRHYLPMTTPSGLIRPSVRFIKLRFDRLVQPYKSRLFSNTDGVSPARFKTLPDLPITPLPSELHAYIRVLGLARDFDGLLKLLRWMSKFEHELELVAQERLGGKRLLRRAVVASRAFLEGKLNKTKLYVDPYAEEDDGRDESSSIDDSPAKTATPKPRSFSDSRLQEAYEIIGDSKFLSPWPADKEVQLYVDNW